MYVSVEGDGKLFVEQGGPEVLAGGGVACRIIIPLNAIFVEAHTSYGPL
jgi:hypothetical protein